MSREHSTEGRNKGLSIEMLERRVFTFDSSESDRKYFLHEFYKWLKNNGNVEGEYKSFTQLLWHVTWIRNDNGKHIKYLFFSERKQKLYLNNYFFQWAKLALDEVEKEMEKLNEQSAESTEHASTSSASKTQSIKGQTNLFSDKVCSICGENPGCKPNAPHLWNGFLDKETGDLVCRKCQHEHYRIKSCNGTKGFSMVEYPVYALDNCLPGSFTAKYMKEQQRVKRTA